jgi:hypothetical protein
VHDVPVTQRSVLAAEEARVLLVHEQTEVRAQPPMLVPQPLRQRRVSADQSLERFMERRRVERDVAHAAREAAVRAMKKYPHLSTTNGGLQDRHRLTSTALEAPGEQRPLGGILRELERPLVSRTRVGRPAEGAEQLPARRVEQVVAIELV